MSENNLDLDALLASAKDEIADTEAKKKAEEAQIAALVSDLDMRWKQVSSRQTPSVVPFVSDLETKDARIESLGFTPELMDSGSLEEKEVEMLQKPLQELREKFSEKRASVEALLKNDILSDAKKEEIRKAWEVSSADFEREKIKLENTFSSKQTEGFEKKQNYEQAQKNQEEFIHKYRGYNAPKMNGKSLFEKLVTDGDDAEWFYDNLLTNEERYFVDELRKNRKEEEDVLLQNHLFDEAKSRTTERVQKEIDERLEKTLGVKESLDELFALEEEDKKVFDAAKEYIKDTFGEKAWKKLEERAAKQLEDLQEDITAWSQNKKGFGKNTRENRKKRLVDSAEPLRKEKKETEESLLNDLSIIREFLDDLYSKRYKFEDNRENISVDQLEKGHQVSEELQAIVQQLEKKREKDVYRQINFLEKATFLDQAEDHEISQKLEELRTYISHRKNIISELKDIQYKQQQEAWNTSAHISEILNNFPSTPDDYYPLDIAEGIKKRRS